MGHNQGMSEWAVALYGDPCRGCGYRWTIGNGDAVIMVSEVPATFGRVLAGATGKERHPDLAWSASAYVSHVADNLRIWAERLAGVTAGAPPDVGGYDQDGLAEARGYQHIPLQAAQWSLSRSVAGWLQAVGQARTHGIVLIHPERGGQSLSDVVLANAHDAFHHRLDIERSLPFTEP